MTTRKNYWDWPSFENIYLEDSYLLYFKHRAELREIEIGMELVLTENHKSFSMPPKDIQYCYIKGIILFDNINHVKWNRYEFQKYTDKAMDIDFGNIDELFKNNEDYILNGDWGEVQITAEKIKLILTA